MEYISFKNERIPLIGFGTWTIGDDPNNEEKEINAIRYAIDNYEMTLIDTAEMYGLGKSEKVVGKAIKGYPRKKLFIVDKILPSNAKKGEYLESCKRSLSLLGVDYIDLYLLHWKSSVNLQDMVNNMENLVKLGLIKHWGVSNFDKKDMEELFKCENGNHCFCNQVLYNLAARGIEYDLLPWCLSHDVLLMAYSPLLNNSNDRNRITSNFHFLSLCEKEDKTPESLLLSFVIRNKKVNTVFKTMSQEHLENNMKNVFIDLKEDTLESLDKMYPSPKKKTPLMKI